MPPKINEPSALCFSLAEDYSKYIANDVITTLDIYKDLKDNTERNNKKMFSDFRNITVNFGDKCYEGVCENVRHAKGEYMELEVSVVLSPKAMVTNKTFEIDRVIFNNPATIVFWKDGTKTVVKTQGEEFDREKGLTMAYVKKLFGNNGNYFNKIKKWTEEK